MIRQSWTGFLHTSTGQMCRSSARFQLQVTMAKILAYMKLIYNDYSKSITSNHHKDNRGCDVTAFWKEVVLLTHILGLKFRRATKFSNCSIFIKEFPKFPKVEPPQGMDIVGSDYEGYWGARTSPLPSPMNTYGLRTPKYLHNVLEDTGLVLLKGQVNWW